MFIPTTKEEIEALGWKQADIIIVSGDTYIDTYYDGAALIGKVLLDSGYKVGIIAQPDIKSDADITRLGEPALFWGVTAGCVDSMVATYTALKKKKRKDDLTPGGINNRRPERAVIQYVNLIKRFFKNSKPVVIGGVEASLRRIANYDYWDDKIRGSVLLDSKADILIYGMAEKTVVQLADALKKNKDFRQIKGLCYISATANPDYENLPSLEEVKSDKLKFIRMFQEFYKNNDPVNAKGLNQLHGKRWLVQNPPAEHLSSEELDKIYSLEFERDAHPYYEKQGKIPALETLRFSVTSHRGCYGECNFCSITIHQGRTVLSRSVDSIVREVEKITENPDFKGYISDVGGPTANMYGNTCKKQLKSGSCKDKRCISSERCPVMKINHDSQVKMLQRLRKINGVKKIFIGSGLRYDLINDDILSGSTYLREIIKHHVSGQLKIAPEHTNEFVLEKMGKHDRNSLKKFIAESKKINKELGLNQFLTYYFIAAHPGCEHEQMLDLKKFVKDELKINPEQIQVFTPTPSTYSTLMYYTGLDPYNHEPVFSEKKLKKKSEQKEILKSKYFAGKTKKR